MAYDKTVWANGTTPAINASNLNKIENELELLDKNTANYVLNGIPNGALAYTNVGALYNGSTSSTLDPSAEPGYYFTGFSRISQVGSSNNFGVIKQIVENMRPPVLSSGQSMDIWFYLDLNSGYDSVQFRRIMIGTSGSWAATQSYVIGEQVVAKAGWNKVNLPVGSTASSAQVYSYAVFTTYVLAEAQKVKGLSIYFSEPTSWASKSTINAESSKNAGVEELDNKISPYVYSKNETSSGTIAWSSRGNKHTLTFTGPVSASNYIQRNVAWDIKSLFGKGAVLEFELTNSNGSDVSFSTTNWFWNAWYLSTSYTSWSDSFRIATISMASYDNPGYKANTSFEIDIDTAFSGIDSTDYDNIYLLAGAYKGKVSDVPSAVLSISANLRFKDSKVYATKVIGFDVDDYYTKDEIEELVEGLIPNYDADLLFWGDSLTAGSGGGGTSYPDVCASILNKTYKNCGVGGESANTIAARQGGNNVIIPAGNINGQYTINQLADTFGYHINPLRQGDAERAGANKLYINDEECTLTITQTSSTSEDAVYTISGYTGRASVFPLLGRFIGSEFTGEVVVIWVGQNGATVNNTNDYNSRIAIIKSMISHIGHDRYVILGRSTGTDSNRADDDNAMLLAFGNKFFPTRRNLVDNGLAISDITPTAQDTADIAVGTVPTSLRSDSTHLNADGYTALGTMLADKIKSLGYFS